MITLQLTQEEIEMCLTGVGNTYLYSKAFPLIEKIRQQAQPQLEPANGEGCGDSTVSA